MEKVIGDNPNVMITQRESKSRYSRMNLMVVLFTLSILTSVHAQKKESSISSKKISPDLFGLFFEDINYAADGGLYAELVQNRSFEYSPTSKKEWSSFSFWEYVTPGFSYGSLNVEHVGNEEKHIGPSGVGIKNIGFDGMAVREGNKYNFSMFARQLTNKSIA